MDRVTNHFEVLAITIAGFGHVRAATEHGLGTTRPAWPGFNFPSVFIFFSFWLAASPLIAAVLVQTWPS